MMLPVINRRVKIEPPKKETTQSNSLEDSTTTVLEPVTNKYSKTDKTGKNKNSSKKNRQASLVSSSATTIHQFKPLLSTSTGYVEAKRPEMILPLSIIKAIRISNQKDSFDEYDTTTRQLSTIIITPAQPDASAEFCIREAIHFGERYVFDYIMYLGYQSPPLIIDPLQYAIGLVRGLPNSWIFDIGNPMVKNRSDDELLGFPEYACQNQVMKKKGLIGKLQGGMMRWEFKADLSAKGPLNKFLWVGTRKNRKLVELELRERQASKRVLALWRSDQSQDPCCGRLWLRRGFPKCKEGVSAQNIKRRWAVAVWLTWRVLLQRK
ncbi:hypothetical protein OnM2_070042 [Erysiphe neolycopersici]|uniref:Uncharacterized protein n=1 Tax=Erysiphe neolycopersici TaxID=212602 RepID=A0A420HKK5_9PEZI|nr:hypothetical protein OnM2_070042 [Erysiphe neolycopersici]